MARRSLVRSATALVLLSLAAAACSSPERPTLRADAPAGSPRAVITSQFPKAGALGRVDLAISLSYLERRFGARTVPWAAPLIDSAVTEAQRGYADDPQSPDFGVIVPFLRLATSGAAAPTELAGGGRTEGGTPVDPTVLTTWALWCDQLAPPHDMMDQVRLSAGTGQYDATHALAAAQLMEENRCGSPRELKGLIDETAKAVAPSVQGSIGDLQLEACAMLAWAGRKDLIPSGYARKVQAAQLHDGGWPERAGDERSDAHATVWGLRCWYELTEQPREPHTDWVDRTK